MVTTAVGPSFAVDRRLERLHIQPVTAVAVVAALIVLVADTQGLSLIPLVGTMVVQYHLNAAEAAIILSIGTITAAGAVPVITSLAERVGLRYFLLAGLATSTIGNILCALAPGFSLLVIGRLVLGLSAATPISLALMREKSRDSHGTTRGIGIVTAGVGVAVAISFLLGGFILQEGGSVSTLFWVMAALSFFSLVVGWVLSPNFKVERKARIDYIGAILIIIGLATFAITISYGATWGWTSGRTIGLFAAALVIIGIWVWVELVQKHPLIDLRLTFHRTTVPAFALVGLYGAMAIISNLAVTAFAQVPAQTLAQFGGPVDGLTDWGHSVLASSLFLMPTALFVFLGGFFAAPIVAKLGVKPTLFVAVALALIAFAQLALFHSNWWENMLGMGIWGLAYALGFSAANSAFLRVARNSQGANMTAASTVVSTSVGSFAAPVYTAVIAGSLFVASIPAATAARVIKANPALAGFGSPSAWTIEWWVCFGIAVVALIITAIYKTHGDGHVVDFTKPLDIAQVERDIVKP